jgi:glycosyltransferase involved in cell wall biosynthesis
MKKITVLYEATLLTLRRRNDLRTGIFFTAYNVLKELAKNTNLDIILYISKNNTRCIKKDLFLSRFKFIRTYPSQYQLEENLKGYKKTIRQPITIIEKMILVLKILRNSLYLFLNLPDRRKKKNESLLQSANVFLSSDSAPNDEIIQHKNILQFIILYDAIPLLYPEFHPNFRSQWYNYIITSLNKELYYFCISESTKRDFLKLFPDKLDEDKMIVTPIAAAQDFFPEYDAKKLIVVFSRYGITYNAGNKYLFSFCSLDPRKNLLFTVKCFILFIKKHKIENLYFYLGGAKTVLVFDKLKEAVGGFNEYRDKIAFLGYVDDGDVNILYSNALFFTYISQYEGFGMPPLEAMQAGVPVITSNNSSLPEVVGDAAISIDYDSEEQCIKAFEDLYFNEDLRRSYIQRGLERAKLFSWEKTAGIISDTIFRAVEKRND